MSNIYKVEEYQRFADNLKTVLKGPNIKSFKLKQLRKPALETAQKTSNGAHSWRSTVSSRIGPKTVYLGSEKVWLPKPSELQQSIIQNAPEELHKVLHLMRTMPFVHIRRRMGDNSEYNPVCNLYISVADRKNYRLAYMWGNTMFDPGKQPGPEFTMIHIPEEHHLRQQVLSIPEHNINIALGTDYMGENKKGFLRQAMWSADQRGMLGLHSGTKIVNVWDEKDQRLKRYGIFLFGLSATGKSTWSCHQLGLDIDKGEGTEVAQDDIVFLRNDGSAYGSEANFFVKTDVERELQEAMYWSLVDKTALYENVMVDAAGNPDFLDEKLCGNGRAVIRKDKLKVKRGRKLVRIDSESVNMPPLSELDGLVFAFITRRNTIMPFSLRLTPEQGVLAYLWGESTHSAASEPAKAGESVRTVGTDPFIVGSMAVKVNRFYDIVMSLVDNYPGKVHFHQYNTGGIGEILEKNIVNGKLQKKLVRKVKRVPINVMAAIQRGDLRETNQYAPGRLGSLEIKLCVDASLDEYNPEKYYSKEQIDNYIKDLVDGRRDYTEFIANQGLRQEIIDAAEKSFSIAGGKKAEVSVPELKQDKPKEEKPPSVSSELPDLKWETKSRPRRSRMGRY